MSKGTLGRKKLAEQLYMGEGAVRTMLSRLSDASLMTASKTGCGLSAEGLNIWEKFEALFPKRVAFSPSELSGCTFNFAFLISGCGKKVESGIEQRDVAVVAGAACAVVVCFSGVRLHIDL
jgi:hypothetical protein